MGPCVENLRKLLSSFLVLLMAVPPQFGIAEDPPPVIAQTVRELQQDGDESWELSDKQIETARSLFLTIAQEIRGVHPETLKGYARAKKKLAERYDGKVTIIQVDGRIAYEISLSATRDNPEGLTLIALDRGFLGDDSKELEMLVSNKILRHESVNIDGKKIYGQSTALFFVDEISEAAFNRSFKDRTYAHFSRRPKFSLRHPIKWAKKWVRIFKGTVRAIPKKDSMKFGGIISFLAVAVGSVAEGVAMPFIHQLLGSAYDPSLWTIGTMGAFGFLFAAYHETWNPFITAGNFGLRLAKGMLVTASLLFLLDPTKITDLMELLSFDLEKVAKGASLLLILGVTAICEVWKVFLTDFYKDRIDSLQDLGPLSLRLIPGSQLALNFENVSRLDFLREEIFQLGPGWIRLMALKLPSIGGVPAGLPLLLFTTFLTPIARLKINEATLALADRDPEFAASIDAVALRQRTSALREQIIGLRRVPGNIASAFGRNIPNAGRMNLEEFEAAAQDQLLKMIAKTVDPQDAPPMDRVSDILNLGPIEDFNRPVGLNNRFGERWNETFSLLGNPELDAFQEVYIQRDHRFLSESLRALVTAERAHFHEAQKIDPSFDPRTDLGSGSEAANKYWELMKDEVRILLALEDRMAQFISAWSAERDHLPQAPRLEIDDDLFNRIERIARQHRLTRENDQRVHSNKRDSPHTITLANFDARREFDRYQPAFHYISENEPLSPLYTFLNQVVGSGQGILPEDLESFWVFEHPPVLKGAVEHDAAALIELWRELERRSFAKLPTMYQRFFGPHKPDSLAVLQSPKRNQIEKFMRDELSAFQALRIAMKNFPRRWQGATLYRLPDPNLFYFVKADAGKRNLALYEQISSRYEGFRQTFLDPFGAIIDSAIYGSSQSPDTEYRASNEREARILSILNTRWNSTDEPMALELRYGGPMFDRNHPALAQLVREQSKDVDVFHALVSLSRNPLVNAELRLHAAKAAFYLSERSEFPALRDLFFGTAVASIILNSASENQSDIQSNNQNGSRLSHEWINFLEISSLPRNMELRNALSFTLTDVLAASPSMSRLLKKRIEKLQSRIDFGDESLVVERRCSDPLET